MSHYYDMEYTYTKKNQLKFYTLQNYLKCIITACHIEIFCYITIKVLNLITQVLNYTRNIFFTYAYSQTFLRERSEKQ